MFNLDDILRQAQGGDAAMTLARQFGITPAQAQAAMESLVPAFQMGLQHQAQQNPQAMGELIQKMASGDYAQAYGDPSAASRAQGVDVLASLFGSKDGSRAVAQQAAAMSGVPASILTAMLPVIASMIMGGMFKQASAQGAGGVLGQLGSILAGGGAGGLGSILGGMLGGGAGRPQPQTTQANTGGGGLGDILGQVLGGALGGGLGGGGAHAPSSQQSGGGLGPLGDILGQVLGGGAAPSRRPTPEADANENAGGGFGGGLGDILGQMMGQGRGRGDQQEMAEPATTPQRRSDAGVEDEISAMLGGNRSAPPQGAAQEEAQAAPQGGSLGDLLGQMFQTGQHTSQAHQDALTEIFAQMTGQRRR